MAKRPISAPQFSAGIDGSSAAVLELPTTAEKVESSVSEPTQQPAPRPGIAARRTRPPVALASPRHLVAAAQDDHGGNRQAELFYLQKQIQLQTQMVFILEDGSRVQGVIEWYDRNAIKVRGKSRVLIYKSALKYLYKAGETGSHSD